MKAKKPVPLVVAASRTCGKPARHGRPCGLDPGHVRRGERHSNGQFTWALRGKEAQREEKTMKNTTKKPIGAPCTSTCGGYKCVLAGPHTEHCNSEKRSGQHMRWSTLEDGSTAVAVYKGSKKTSNWVDAPKEPPAPAKNEQLARSGYCGEEFKTGPNGGISVCTLPEGHGGARHENTSTGAVEMLEADDEDSDDPFEDEVRSDDDRAFAKKMREDREAHARELERENEADREPALTDLCDKCHQEIGAHDGVRCPKPYGFVLLSRGEILCKDGEFHDSDIVGLGGEKAPQVYKTKAAAGASARHQHRVTEIVPWHGAPPRKSAQPAPKPVAEIDVTKLADEEQAEAADHDPKTPGFQQEPAPKPGDTRTVDGHAQRWCWGPDGWGWRDYKAAGKGCAGCGRHKADCLCRAMKDASAEPVAEPERPSAPLAEIGGHAVHPAAALFPMISEAKWPAFVDDIRANGQRHKIVRIWVDDRWLILDGRNRLRACIELRIEPKFRTFGDEATDGDDPIAYVTSENIQRRQLDETELAYVGLELVPMYEAQARERQRAAQNNNSGRAVSATLREQGPGQGKAAEAAAKAVGVSPRTIESAIKVQRDAAPEVLAASKDRGLMAVSAAAELAKLPKPKQREIMEREDGKKITLGKAKSLVRQEEKRSVVREINEQKVAPAPMGPFGVIVIDPPWPYDNSDQHEGSRGHIDYPSMSIQALCDLAPQLNTRAKEDCILGLWVTNAFIHEVGRLLFSWGFEHRTMITWDKEIAGVGTLPRGQTEHLVIATRGAPVHTLNEVTTMLRVKRREHSRKPDEMYALLAKHCPGPHIDMFSRESREGWSTWGAETDKFATEAA